MQKTAVDLDAILRPIAGDNPSGRNLRYGGLYEAIKEARREDDRSLPLGDWQHDFKFADFRTVIKLAEEALKTQTKDLQVAGWLVDAKFRTEGFSGLSEGLIIVKGLLTEFWDTIFPELENGDDPELRAAILEWLDRRVSREISLQPITAAGGSEEYSLTNYVVSQNLGYEAEATDEFTRLRREQAIAEGVIPPERFDAAWSSTPMEFYSVLNDSVNRAIEALNQLTTTVIDRFGDSAPSFRRLRSALDDIVKVIVLLLENKSRQQIPPPLAIDSEWNGTIASTATGATKKQDGERTLAPSAGEGAPETTRVAPVITAEPVSPLDAVNRLLSSASFLRREDPFSTVPYVVMRVLRWGELSAAGHPLDRGLLVAPPTSDRIKIKKLSEGGEWPRLLEAVEDAMSKEWGRGWLDLQRHAIAACDNMGTAYSPIGNAIRSQLTILLGEFPELLSATLTDDTPCANADTVSWIREVISHYTNVEPTRRLLISGDESLVARDESSELPAVSTALGADVAANIRLLTSATVRAHSSRDRFRKKAHLAEYCLSVGHIAMAKSILEELTDHILRLQLDSWESPEELAYLFVMLYKCLENTSIDVNVKNSIYSHICRLDPSQAPDI